MQNIGKYFFIKSQVLMHARVLIQKGKNISKIILNVGKITSTNDPD